MTIQTPAQIFDQRQRNMAALKRYFAQIEACRSRMRYTREALF